MLRYYRELRRSVIHTLNTRNTREKPRRLFVFNHDTETEEQAFDASEDCSRSYDLSPDGRLLATGYWRNRGISVWDVDSGQLHSNFGPTQVWSVHFDRTSSQLLVKAESGTAVYPVAPPHEALPIKNAGKTDCGCFVGDENRYLFPSRRRSTLIDVDFDRRTIGTIDVPIPRTIRWMRHSPAAPRVFIIDASATVWCFDSSLKELFWKTNLKRLAGRDNILVGAYSGNGQRIGVTVTRDDGWDTIILGADTGEVLDTIEDASCSGYPYGDDSVLEESGQILNLGTKQTSEGFSSIADYRPNTSGKRG